MMMIMVLLVNIFSRVSVLMLHTRLDHFILLFCPLTFNLSFVICMRITTLIETIPPLSLLRVAGLHSNQIYCPGTTIMGTTNKKATEFGKFLIASNRCQ